MIVRELKRIVRPWQTAVLLLLLVVTFMMYMPFDSGRNYSWYDYEAAFARELQKKGFDSFTEDAEVWMRQELEQIRAQYEAYFAEDPLFFENGIVTWDDFDQWEIPEEMISEVIDHLDRRFNPVLNELTVSWKRQIIERMLSCAEIFESGDISVFVKNYGLTVSEQKDLEKILSEERWRSLLPDGTVYNTNQYWKAILYGLILSVFFLITPYLTSENVQKMRSLQYSSKTGRKILVCQFFAALLASVILFLVWAGIFLILFETEHHYSSFFNMGIFGLNYDVSRFTMSYFTYLTVILFLCFAAVMTAMSVSCMIAYTSTNYISMFLKMILGAGAVCMVHSTWMFEGEVFSMANLYNRLFHVKGIEIILTVCVLILCGFIIIRLILRCEKEDLL